MLPSSDQAFPAGDETLDIIEFDKTVTSRSVFGFLASYDRHDDLSQDTMPSKSEREQDDITVIEEEMQETITVLTPVEEVVWQDPAKAVDIDSWRRNVE